MSEPRGRRFQGDDFEVAELRGRTLEVLVGASSPAESDDRPQILLLKPESGHWQRFFLDAGVGFWEECSQADAFEDVSDLRRIDYGARFRIVGHGIRRVRCYRVEPEKSARIAIELDSGTLELRPVDPGRLDSGCEVVFRATGIG